MDRASAPTAEAAPPALKGEGRAFLVRLVVRGPTSVIGFTGVGLLLLLMLIGPLLAPHDPAALSAQRLQPPTPDLWMGTDNFGRDVLSRFLHGTRLSMLVGLGAVIFSLAVGSLFGMVAGVKAGSLIDAVIMRLVDVVLAFPLIVLVTVLSGVLQTRSLVLGPIAVSNMVLVGLAIGVVGVPIFARLARASVLVEMREDYVLAARALGARTRDLVFGNLLPNIQAPLVVQAAFSLAIAIALESAVSFLGLGVQPPDASWGTMLADARRFVLLGAWWLVVFPSTAIIVAVLSFNLLGDVLRDALDPRVWTGTTGLDVEATPTSDALQVEAKLP